MAPRTPNPTVNNIRTLRWNPLQGQQGPGAGKPPTPPAPAVPGAPGTATRTGPYMDAAFLAWQARDTFDRNQEITQLAAEDATDEIARKEALRRMALQREQGAEANKVNFNRQGLFYSGQLGKAQDELAADFIRQERDLDADYDARLSSREETRRALINGSLLDEGEQLALAAERGVDRDAQWAAANALAPAPPVTPRNDKLPPIKAPVAPKPLSKKQLARQRRLRARRVGTGMLGAGARAL